MPVYEYYCEPCNGVFELLRPVRDAQLDQPCPECERGAKRIVSQAFTAFTFRDGMPRRLPDDGSYWHLEQKVSSPINGPSYQGVVHPEFAEPLDGTSVEEIERWEHTLSARRETEAEIDGTVIDSDFEREKTAFAERLAGTRGSKSVEHAKRRLIRRDMDDLRNVRQAKARRAKKNSS